MNTTNNQGAGPAPITLSEDFMEDIRDAMFDLSLARTHQDSPEQSTYGMAEWMMHMMYKMIVEARNVRVEEV